MSAADVDRALADELAESYPADAARVLERLESADCAALLGELDVAVAASVLRAMATPAARAALAAMPAAAAGAVVGALSVPWGAALLRTASAERRAAVFAEVDQLRAEDLARILSHRADSVAAVTDPAVLSLPPDVTAGDAVEQVRAAVELDRDVVYVVDRSGALVGVVGVAAVVSADPARPLAELAEGDVVALDADADAASVATHPGWARWRSLPVVDRAGLLVGAARYAAVQRLLLGAPAGKSSAIGLPASLAELFWLGLTGVTDGLARVVTRPEADER